MGAFYYILSCLVVFVSLASATVRACNAVDIATIKAQVLHPVYFCTFFTEQPRARSALPALTPSQLSSACTCIVDSSKVVTIDSSSTHHADGCVAADVAALNREYKNPSAFCAFYQNGPSRSNSPIPNMSPASLQWACACRSVTSSARKASSTFTTRKTSMKLASSTLPWSTTKSRGISMSTSATASSLRRMSTFSSNAATSPSASRMSPASQHTSSVFSSTLAATSSVGRTSPSSQHTSSSPSSSLAPASSAGPTSSADQQTSSILSSTVAPTSSASTASSTGEQTSSTLSSMLAATSSASPTSSVCQISTSTSASPLSTFVVTEQCSGTTADGQALQGSPGNHGGFLYFTDLSSSGAVTVTLKLDPLTGFVYFDNQKLYAYSSPYDEDTETNTASDPALITPQLSNSDPQLSVLVCSTTTGTLSCSSQANGRTYSYIGMMKNGLYALGIATDPSLLVTGAANLVLSSP